MEEVCENPPHFQRPGLGRKILLWGVFFLICLGLGYPTLNRYDPRKALPDSTRYAKLVTDGPRQVEGYFRFRVLEPYLVRPLYDLAKGRVGSWDPLFFGFLIVNSFFVAGVAYLTSALGYVHLRSYPVALFGAALYLLNFAPSNAQLAGLVDAGEAFFLMAMVASMFFERWWLLPVFGVLGTLTKESFVLFSVTMSGTWWLVSRESGTNRTRCALWLAVMAIVEFATVTVLQSCVSGQLTWPWSFAAGLNSHSNHAMTFLISLADKDSWYIFIWLLPLGLLRIRQFPRPWVWAATSASFVALLLNAYSTVPGVEGGLGRYIFNVAGPLLSLSVASFLCRIKPGFAD